ncbi:MAG: LysM peptidoglycan-binding domain-containing protein [Candidatus Omnitrophota bacterium]|nr:LysM peptidoglycan-binding domain-containing protein [Candidatus Omnitrophota bacterium]
MKNMILCCIVLAIFMMSGCVTRTYTTQIDRVDQEIYGNRGVIVGTPPPVEETDVKKTREVYNLEVEVPSLYKGASSQNQRRAYKKERVREDDRDLDGNRGYVQGSISPEKEVYVPETTQGQQSNVRISGGSYSGRTPQVVYSEPSSKTSSSSVSGEAKEYYVVEKGDTLQTISEKFYGTTKKWTVLYEANKHILKSPDRIRPGQKLVIPKD